MKKSDLASLTALAALWGASYLFMRVGAGEFGALTLAGARAAIAAVLLMLLLASDLRALRRHWKPVLLVGVTNSALPFVLFALAALGINASLSAIFNAATPLYAAVIGRVWLGEAIGRTRAAGLALGFCGVLWLVAEGASFKPGASAVTTGWAVLACVAATMLYAFSAHFSKRYLAAVPPLAVAAGSQVGVGTPTEMTAPARHLQRQLLRLSGPEFDRVFLKALIKDHRKAIAKYEEQRRSGEAVTRKLAEDVLPHLSQHLQVALSLQSGG